MKMNSHPNQHPLSSPAALTSGRRSVHLHSLHAPAWVLAVFLVVGTLPVVQAQTTYHTGAANFLSVIRGANFPVTDPVTYNAVEMDTADGNLLYVDDDVDFKSGGINSIFTSMSWVAPSRVSASLLGCDEMAIPVSKRTLAVRNLALTNVDLNADNVQLGFQPPDGYSSLTLNNASLTGQFTPFLYSPAHFNLNASGTSTLANWSGLRSSVTTLNVASGGSLRFKDCGDVTAVSLADMLYLTLLQNRAFINGGTLIVDNSAVVFGARDSDIEHASMMTFSNNATLRLEGSGYYTKLETDQFLFQNSTLILSNHPTRLNVRRTLELDNSSAIIADGARVSALEVLVTNNSTVGLKGNLTQGLVTDFLEITSGSTLTLLGLGVEDGELAVNSRVYFPRWTGGGVGTLHVTDRTYLTMAGGSIMELDAHGILTTTPLGFIALQEAFLTLHGSGTFTNAGSFTVQAPSALTIFGNAAIAGAGSMTMAGWLDFTQMSATNQAKNSLTTGNQMYFNSTAQVHMNLDPTGLTSDRLICSNSIDLNNHPALSLGVVNDQPLPPGTKFVLIDYRDYKGEFTIFDGKYSRFTGYTNHQTFTLGLNTYEINYHDDTYVPGTEQFVTLVVVSNAACGVLNLSQQDTNALVCWSATCTNFLLEATYSLGTNASTNALVWTPVPGTPVLNGGQLCVTVPLEATNRFFRLRQP